jgi:hypothetical protein
MEQCKKPLESLPQFITLFPNKIPSIEAGRRRTIVIKILTHRLLIGCFSCKEIPFLMNWFLCCNDEAKRSLFSDSEFEVHVLSLCVEIRSTLLVRLVVLSKSK